MTTRRLNDPALVRAQYASEKNLNARIALWREMEGPDPKQVLCDTLAAVAPKRVLEVGGGDGWLSAWLRDELGCEVTMLDQSERMVELATERGLDARVGNVESLPFADGAFDTVVAAWMLYHVHDIDRGLSEIVRVLTAGGHLVANTNSRRHCEEVFDLIKYPREAREWVFNAENGEESLHRHFSDVRRENVVAVATVRDRETLVNYQQSMLTETQPVPDHVQLPLRVHSRSVVFVATK
ncbi:MAG TPA: class I SAM-dependent methyltransferase [Gaiellaceae bacterium]|nr:class I SAM-dependent methyltransferase [Gaiellaceae bacterium]